MFKDVVCGSVGFVQWRRFGKLMRLPPVGEVAHLSILDEFVHATGDAADFALDEGTWLHLQKTRGDASGDGLIDHADAVAGDPNFLGGIKVVLVPRVIGLFVGDDVDVGAGLADIGDELGVSTSGCGQHNGAAAVAGDVRNLVEQLFAVPFVFATGTANEEEDVALLSFGGLGLDTVEYALGCKDFFALVILGFQIVLGHKFEGEEAAWQTGAHADHAGAFMLARHADGGEVRAVTRADNQVHLLSRVCLPLVAESLPAGEMLDVEGLDLMLKLGLQLAGSLQNGFCQTPRLIQVPFFTIGNDADVHGERVVIVGRVGLTADVADCAIKLLPKVGAVDGAAGQIARLD